MTSIQGTPSPTLARPTPVHSQDHFRCHLLKEGPLNAPTRSGPPGACSHGSQQPLPRFPQPVAADMLWKGFPAHRVPFLGNRLSRPWPSSSAPGPSWPWGTRTVVDIWIHLSHQMLSSCFGTGAERCLSSVPPVALKENCRPGRELWASQAWPRAGRPAEASPPPSCSQPSEKASAPGTRRDRPATNQPGSLPSTGPGFTSSPDTWAGPPHPQGSPRL